MSIINLEKLKLFFSPIKEARAFFTEGKKTWAGKPPTLVTGLIAAGLTGCGLGLAWAAQQLVQILTADIATTGALAVDILPAGVTAVVLGYFIRKMVFLSTVTVLVALSPEKTPA